MSVSFSEKLVEVREFEVSSNESTDKRKTYQKIRQECKDKSFLARILYAPYQREHQYVDLKIAGKRPIKCIATNNSICSFRELYRENGKKIEYRIFRNENGKLCLQIETKRLGQKFYKEYYDMGCDLADMYVAEYRAKTELISIVRRICEDSQIY